MRHASFLVRGLVALALLTPAASRAHAQSLFQKLFGMDSSSGPPQRSGLVPSVRSFGRFSPYGLGESPGSYLDPRPPSDYASSYRTVCVRMCDGYYWPISSSAARGKFYADAKVCRSSCDSEARLFYLPASSDDVEHMTDLTGRAYGRLPAAFAYRTSLASGCACKPMPWSEAEQARHQSYAASESMKGPGDTLPAAPGPPQAAAELATAAAAQGAEETAPEPISAPPVDDTLSVGLTAAGARVEPWKSPPRAQFPTRVATLRGRRVPALSYQPASLSPALRPRYLPSGYR